MLSNTQGILWPPEQDTITYYVASGWTPLYTCTSRGVKKASNISEYYIINILTLLISPKYLGKSQGPQDLAMRTGPLENSVCALPVGGYKNCNSRSACY